MYWESPYLAEGQWLRGSLHTHTTVSDGAHHADEVARLYGQAIKNPRSPHQNYRFLALTDHTKNTRRDQFKLPKTDELIILEGREESFAHHILGIGCRMLFDEDIIGKSSDDYTLADYQKIIDSIVEDGGLAVLAHPHWLQADYWSKEAAAALKGYTAIEIINGDLFAAGANLATDVWDAALTAGRRVWGVGGDDFHTVRDFHNAWTYVYAKDASPISIMDALRHGSMYASNGAAFERVYADGQWIVAECANDSYYIDCEKTFKFIGEGGQIRQLQTGKNCVAAYKGQGNEQYIRVELLLNQGGAAFAQPFFRLA